MNTTLQIKTGLINRINSIDDLNFLQAIQTIFDATEKNLFPLNDDQVRSISRSRKQIASGQYKGNNEVLFELRKWLKRK